MPAEFADAALAQIHPLIDQFSSPIPDIASLLSLLTAPLAAINLLQPNFHRYNIAPLPPNSFSIQRHLPPLQRALLEHLLPAWGSELKRRDLLALSDQYFVPDTFSFGRREAGEVVLTAYSTILSSPLTDRSIELLVNLTKAYPIDRLHAAIFDSDMSTNPDRLRRSTAWEDCVRNVVAVPAKVANALGPRTGPSKIAIPEELENGNYSNSLSVRFEALLWEFSKKSLTPSQEKLNSLTYLLTKLTILGLFPHSPPTNPNQPSFFHATLPSIREHLAITQNQPQYPNPSSYQSLWHTLLASLTPIHLQSVLSALFAELPHSPSTERELEGTGCTRAQVKKEALLLDALLGTLEEGNDGLGIGNTAGAAALARNWGLWKARVWACWAALGGNPNLEFLLQKVLDVWASHEHIKHSLLSFHHYITTLLLITLTLLPASHASSLALSGDFIRAIGTYIGHLDLGVRRCGMVVAEVVACRAGKTLDFGDSEVTAEGKGWEGKVRRLIEMEGRGDAGAEVEKEEASVDEEERGTEEGVLQGEEILASSENQKRRSHVSIEDGDSDDDSLIGYSSTPAGSRSPSPTPSDLEEIEKDPTLNVGRKPIPRPVYLFQLGQMLRGMKGGTTAKRNGLEEGMGINEGGSGGDGSWEEAERVRIALDCAEELVKRRWGFGSELEENAVNLVYALVSLNNNYELDNFEVKRQGALNALVARCPRKSAPAVIQEFFRNQYSTDQRYVMLNALALGARELASLPTTSSALQPLSKEKLAWPGKRLPEPLHRKLIAASSIDDPVGGLLMDISREAIEKSKEPAAEKVPELVRERRLRVRQPAKVTEVSRAQVTPNSALQSWQVSQAQAQSITFTNVAAEYFTCPLIDQFWSYLRDSQAREDRTAQHDDKTYRYRGAGTGLILSPMVLERFLQTLAVLVHAGRNAVEWLAVVAPAALEVALTLGTRPVTSSAFDDGDEDEEGREEGGSKEAAVLTAAFEVALVVFDGALELDGGRSLGLEHTALVLGCGEWAGKVLEGLEKGNKVKGGGGVREGRLRRAVAGVLLKVDELSEKWRRSMIDVT